MAPNGRIRRRGLVAAVAVATAAALALGTASLAASASPSPSTSTSPATADAARAAKASKRAFHDAMRQLWEEHVTWTRLFIVSFVSDVPDLQATTDRLLRNQVDIGDAVKPFYGRKAGNRLTGLLTEHILTAADLLAAAKSGDTAAFDPAKSDWYANARQIARFLHDANPDHWSLADLRSMMKMHLDLTLQEAADQVGGDYAAAVADYDAVEAEILGMADMLSSGIVAQFPNRFS